MHENPPSHTSSTPSVLITGASGNVGRELVERLAAKANVRRFDRRQVQARPGIGSVVGDLTDVPSIRAALQGIDTVFLIWPLLDSSAAEPLMTELVAASPRVIYLSSTAVNDAADRQSDPITQVHADMEALLRASRLRLTVLRSDTLASNTRGWASQIRTGNVVKGPELPVTAIVDERDVAAAASAVILRPHEESERNAYLLTGPELLSRRQQVHILGTALGRHLRFEPISAETARAQMLADGRPGHLVDALIASSINRRESDLITDHVEQLTRQQARTYAHWARDHRQEFERPS